MHFQRRQGALEKNRSFLKNEFVRNCEEFSKTSGLQERSIIKGNFNLHANSMGGNPLERLKYRCWYFCVPGSTEMKQSL